MDTRMSCDEFRRLYKEVGLETIEARVTMQMGVHGDGCYDCKAWIDQERVRALAEKIHHPKLPSGSLF